MSEWVGWVTGRLRGGVRCARAIAGPQPALQQIRPMLPTQIPAAIFRVTQLTHRYSHSAPFPTELEFRVEPLIEHKVVHGSSASASTTHCASSHTAMTYLSTHLPFPEQSEHKQHAAALPPPGSHLLITDSPLSPAHFAVYHLIASAIARKQKVVWVDFRHEGKSSLEAVLRKMVSRRWVACCKTGLTRRASSSPPPRPVSAISHHHPCRGPCRHQDPVCTTRTTRRLCIRRTMRWSQVSPTTPWSSSTACPSSYRSASSPARSSDSSVPCRCKLGR